MVIRNLHLSDFLKLGRLHEANVGLDVLGSLVLPHSPRSAVLSQHLPVPVQNFNTSIYIYEEPEGKPTAFVQTRVRPRRDEWDILALGTVGVIPQINVEQEEKSEEVATLQSEIVAVQTVGDISLELERESQTLSDDDEVGQTELSEAEESSISWPSISDAEICWLRLLEHLVVDAGEKGAMRVYARLMEDSPETTLFSQVGFHTFTRESLFQLNYQNALEKPADLKLRPQHKRDLFPIDQLYRAVAPTTVQYAESTSSRTWALSRNYFPRPVKEQGFVLEDKDKVVAYLRILSYRNRHLLTLMCLDSHREMLSEIIRFGLCNLKAGEDTQVYCAVREYQAEQENILEDFGFVHFGRQAAMVKQIVQYIKNPERALVHARDHKLELAHSVIKNRVRHSPKAIK